MGGLLEGRLAARPLSKRRCSSHGGLRAQVRGGNITEKLKTVWVRIYGNKCLYLKLSDGSIVKKNGKLYIQPPMLMLSIWEKEKNVHFGLFSEEVSRLVYVLDELARTVYRAELRIFYYKNYEDHTYDWHTIEKVIRGFAEEGILLRLEVSKRVYFGFTDRGMKIAVL